MCCSVCVSAFTDWLSTCEQAGRSEMEGHLVTPLLMLNRNSDAGMHAKARRCMQ